MKKPFIYAWPKTGGKAGARWRENVYQFRIALELFRTHLGEFETFYVILATLEQFVYAF